MADYSPYIQAAAQMLQTVGQAASGAQQQKLSKEQSELGFSDSKAQFAKNMALRDKEMQLAKERALQNLGDRASANLQNTLVQQSAQGGADLQGLAERLSRLYASGRR